MKKECGECMNYEPMNSEADHDFFYGQCKFSPPVAIVSKDDFIGRDTPAIWPEVLSTDWCSGFNGGVHWEQSS